jgi:hypothetical protein
LDDEAAAASLPASFLSLDEAPPADELSLVELSLDGLTTAFYLITSPPPSPPSPFSSSDLALDESLAELEALSEDVNFDYFNTFLVSEAGLVTFFVVASSPWAKL